MAGTYDPKEGAAGSGLDTTIMHACYKVICCPRKDLHLEFGTKQWRCLEQVQKLVQTL